MRTATPTGLTSAEARRRLEEFGPNAVTVARSRPLWRMITDQLTDTMIVVLLGAAALTAAIGDLTDMAVIVVVIVANGAIGVSQELRATRAMTALARLSAPRARVVRDGAVTAVDATEVVPADVLLLEAGDVVPADADLVEAQGLQVEEAMLTGESVPVEKSADAVVIDEEAATRPSRVYAGTVVTRGRATALVRATGMRTALGGIAGALQGAEPPRTPLQRRLARLGRQLSLLAGALCAVVLVLGLLRGQPLDLMLVTAISLAVAAIPESLPAVVTLSLALGAQRMAARNAVIRHLPAVETLGSVTVIATDKTGTITEGRMTAARLWTVGTGDVDLPPVDQVERVRPGPVVDLVEAAALCNDAREPADGDPTEVALLALGRRLGVDVAQVRISHPRIAEVPFDSARARMTTVHRRPQGDVLVVCKGAPEAVLGRLDTDESAQAAAEQAAAEQAAAEQAAAEQAAAEQAAAEQAAAEQAAEQAAALAAGGYRVLAVATATRAESPGMDPDDLDHGLRLLGLIALEDPPRDRAPEAVAACRTAGIRPVMITGDHPATAAAIARRVGILDDSARVLTGRHLRAGKAPDGATAGTGLDDVRVFARTLPEQKLDLVRQWQSAGHVVAMTGDGVNDAPALRTADIGVAMGRGGTEVAKEAADMVLADDDFATIVSAIHEGRRVYANVRRFLSYALAGGGAAILVMLAGPFLGLTVPLLAAQILWINLLTHGLPGVAFGVEPAEPDAMRRPPRPPAEDILGSGLWLRVVLLATLIAGTSLALGVWAERTGRPWQTVVFVSLALLQLVSVFALRSETTPAWRLGLRSNPLLVGAVVLNVVLLLAVVYWPAAQPIFHTTPLPAGDLAIVALGSLTSFAAVEAAKVRRRRRAGPAAASPTPRTGRR